MTDTDTSPSLLIDVAASWSPDQALVVVSLLDSLASAIWQVHGEAMSELIADRGHRLIADQPWALHPPPPAQYDLPF